MKDSTKIVELPDDILLLIFDCLDHDTPKWKLPPIAYSFTILRVLSCVCRRFKNLLLAKYLKRDLVYRDGWQWRRLVMLRPFDDERRIYVPSARSLTIGHAVPGHYEELGAWDLDAKDLTFDSGRAMPVGQLTSFECTDALFDSRDFHLLDGAYPSLQSLTLVWKDQDTFPPLHSLPNIDHLRLYVRHPIEECQKIPLAALVPRTFNSITHLTIHNINVPKHPALSRIAVHCLCHMTFPQLKVVNFQGLRVDDPEDFFTFVHRHSTLLEVNLDLPNVRMRLASVLKLIEGTGTWRKLTDDEAQTYKIPGGVVDHIIPNGWERPEKLYTTVDMTNGPVSGFAFTRKPLNSEATKWRSPVGSEQARYTGTALALYISRRVPVQTLYLPNLMKMLGTYMPDLQELRVWSELDQGSSVNGPIVFTKFMVEISKGLHDMSHVRRLSLLWPIRPSPWREVSDWVWDRRNAPAAGATPYIGHVYPPCISYYGKSIEDFEENEWDRSLVEATREAVSDALRTPYERLDRRDPNVLLHAWEAAHEVEVANIMHHIAASCPFLEHIDWYPDERGARTWVRWSWKVHRREDRSVRLVNGDLTWTGCARGNPPPFVVLAGEELEEFYRNASGRYFP